MPARLPLPLRRTWFRLRGSFWFTPTLVVLGSMLLAAGLVELDVHSTADLARWSPRLFGAGADGSRAMLSAIATSMATVAGVVFSITVLTLSLKATEYTPRVLRNFMRDAPTQLVLGVFVGIFAYCLVVLRTIRGGDEGEFVPSIAVLGALGYAFAGMGVLIYFIHHTALGIQVSSILGRIADDTRHAIDHLFPQELGEAPAPEVGDARLPHRWHPVRASGHGYVQAIDADALLRQACACGTVVRLCVGVGAYVSERTILLEAGLDGGADREALDRMAAVVLVGSERTVAQDAAFGLQQMVDVALRALSPAVNDPTTACMCANELGRLLAHLAGRAMPAPARHAEGSLRVISPVPDFGRMVDDALAPVIGASRGDLEVLRHIVDALETICAACSDPRRAAALRSCVADVQYQLARVRPQRRAQALHHRVRALATRIAPARRRRGARGR